MQACWTQPLQSPHSCLLPRPASRTTSVGERLSCGGGGTVVHILGSSPKAGWDATMTMHWIVLHRSEWTLATPKVQSLTRESRRTNTSEPETQTGVLGRVKDWELSEDLEAELEVPENQPPREDGGRQWEKEKHKAGGGVLHTGEDAPLNQGAGKSPPVSPPASWASQEHAEEEWAEQLPRLIMALLQEGRGREGGNRGGELLGHTFLVRSPRWGVLILDSKPPPPWLKVPSLTVCPRNYITRWLLQWIKKQRSIMDI